MKLKILVVLIILAIWYTPKIITPDPVMQQVPAQQAEEKKEIKITQTTNTITNLAQKNNKPKLEFREMSEFEKKIVVLVNEERIKAGLNTLAIEPFLNAGAIFKVNNLIETKRWRHAIDNYGHSTANILLDDGYKFNFCDENLAKDFTTPEATVQAWMESTGHRQNILDTKMNRIGVASMNYITVLLMAD